ncbi:hypothetical protein Nepgr_000291 [Nepenthes gracilis]|uniref:Uncharacterized protein n=1 Tax=Nepenthes gracilis TaxID=150966 RepID=A0AAD3P3M1_NEPGR|nr:hypothetical protein Nepgr_000291 [Nepenthes gracilis]
MDAWWISLVEGHSKDALGLCKICPWAVILWKSIPTASLKHGSQVIDETTAMKAIELAPIELSSIAVSGVVREFLVCRQADVGYDSIVLSKIGRWFNQNFKRMGK